MRTGMSITNSKLVAVRTAEQVLEHLFNYDCRAEIVRVDIYAPEPFAPGKRDVYVELHFARGNAYGSVQVRVLLQSGERKFALGAGERWQPERSKVVSTGMTGPGAGKIFRFQNGMMSDDNPAEAAAAWAEADSRRVTYTLRQPVEAVGQQTV